MVVSDELDDSIHIFTGHSGKISAHFTYFDEFHLFATHTLYTTFEVLILNSDYAIP